MTRRVPMSLLAAAWAVAVFVSACGSGGGAEPDPFLVSQAVGPAGGVVEIPGTKLAVEIPPGALADTETITVARASDAPPNAVGRAYELGPDGLAFAVPAVLRYEASPGDLPGDGLPEDFRVLTHDGSEWVEVDGWFPDANGISAEIDHFSRYVIVNLDGAGIFHGTFGFASDEIYAFGRDVDLDGTIVRWDGEDADPVQTLASGRYYDGWGASATRLYAVAYDGQGVIHLSTDRGRSWTEDHRSGAGVPVFAVHGAGDLVVAVGRTILEKDETNAAAGWSDVSAGGLQLADVVVFADGSAIAVGVDTVLGRDASDGSWSSMAPLGVFSGRYDLRAVWARASNEVYVAGYGTVGGVRGPVVLKYDGSAWTLEPIVSWAGRMEGIGGDGTHVVAVGRSGMMQVLDAAWSIEDLERTEDLLDVWVIDLDHLALVGTRGLASFPGLIEPPPGGGGPSKPIVYHVEYFTGTSEESDVWSLEADGSNWTELTDTPVDSTYPTWSPDGTRVIYLENQDLYEMGSTGANRRLIKEGAGWRNLRWAPNDDRIAYSYNSDGNDHVFVFDLDTGQSIQITSDDTFDGHPAWSPDGSELVFDREGDLYVAAADGTGTPRPLLTGDDYCLEPTWSALGTIAFVKDGDIWLVDADGSNERLFLVSPDRGDLASAYYEPDWSSDGTKLAFVHVRYPDQYLILVSDLDGNITEPAGQQAPEREGASARFPDW